MKIKNLLAAALMAIALVGCGAPSFVYEAEIIPGAEASMIAMCETNGGFVRGWTKPQDEYTSGRVATLIQYATLYHVECANGAKIDKVFQGRKV